MQLTIPVHGFESEEVESLQVSRLIEMQTPLYLEGVRYIHPYFHEKRRGSEI